MTDLQTTAEVPKPEPAGLTLKSITRDRADKPPITVVYGAGGVGKSTLAATFPDPVFILTEDGLMGIEDVDATPVCGSFSDVLEIMRELIREDHSWKTVVVDSVTRLEALIWDDVCKANKWKSIEQGGYGKGYVEAQTRWARFLTAVHTLRDRAGLLPLLIAHDEIRTFTDPVTEPYDRVQLRLHRKADQIVRESADLIGLLAQDVVVSGQDGGAKRAQGSGQRIIRLTPRPGWVAKSRFRDTPDVVRISPDDGFGDLAGALPTLARFAGVSGEKKTAAKKAASKKEKAE